MLSKKLEEVICIARPEFQETWRGRTTCVISHKSFPRILDYTYLTLKYFARYFVSF